MTDNDLSAGPTYSPPFREWVPPERMSSKAESYNQPRVSIETPRRNWPQGTAPECWEGDDCEH